MPIFSRRAIQLMLDELGPWLTRSKALDILNRVEKHDDADQTIPAEYELGISWAVSKLAELEISPTFGGKNPDLYSENLWPGQPMVIEITALSDDALSDKSVMNRTANIINQFADTVRRKASNNLYFTFLERSGYKKMKLEKPIGPWKFQSQYFREGLASRKFKLTDAHRTAIREWLKEWPPKSNLQINGEGTAVIVSWQKWVHPHSKTHSSMPSEVHDLKDNPIYERLKEKEKQLSTAPKGSLKCIILGDAGCTLLRIPKDHFSGQSRKSGQDIIYEFLRNSSVDVVCILSPRRKNENSISDLNNPRLWHTFIYDKWQRPEGFQYPFERIRALLPPPYLHGYQARSWVEQGLMSPQSRGQYLGLSFHSRGGFSLKAKISARAVLELLAGRLSPEQYQKMFFRDHRNQFEYYLSQGYGISDVALESTEADRDDDYLVISLAPDPNASALRLPDSLMKDEES